MKSRLLSVKIERESLIQNMMTKPFTATSKVVAQALIDYRDDLNLPIKEYAMKLAQHKAQNVRTRAEYLLSKIESA